jgi:hypothetical protein
LAGITLHAAADNKMKTRDKNRIVRDAATGRFVLGRERFAKISAVEGVARTPAMKEQEKEFDRQGLTVEERHREIIRTYRSKT